MANQVSQCDSVISCTALDLFWLTLERGWRDSDLNQNLKCILLKKYRVLSDG